MGEIPLSNARSDERPLKRSARPARTVQEILSGDSHPPHPSLLHASGHTVGTEPIDARRYYEREFYDAEVNRMWSRVWQFACWTYDIPKPGDVHVYRLAHRSVLIVRQPDNGLKAFANSCLHRGREICVADTSRTQLRCPFHHFTWRLDGTLKSIPTGWDFPQVDTQSHSLPEVQVDEWNGFVFVNFDPKAPPLKQYMGKMTEHWVGWDFKATRFKAVHVEKTIRCNWKVVQEPFLEAMHVFASHPQIASMSYDAATQYDIYADEPHFSRFHSPVGLASPNLDPQPSEQEILNSFAGAYLPEVSGTEQATLLPGESAREGLARLARKVYQDRLGVDLTRASEAELLDGTEYFLFPNFLPWASVGNPIVYRFRPTTDPEVAIWDTLLFLPFEGKRPPSCSVIRVGPDQSLADVPELGYLSEILQQDAEQCEPIQRGLKSSVTHKLALSEYQEVRIRHMHQTLDKYLNGEL